MFVLCTGSELLRNCSAQTHPMATKRRRLHGVAGAAGVSSSALASILEHVRANRDILDREVSARTINRDIAASFAVTCGESHTLHIKGEPRFQWRHASLQALLVELCSRSSVYSRLLEDALASVPPGRPLHLLLYLDEVSPGNILKPANNRKFWAFYVGFKEFSAAALTHALAWLPVAVLRTSIAKKVQGGLSACVLCLLRAFFAGTASLSAVGVLLPWQEPRLLHVRFGNLLGDEAALRQVYDSKGASGLLPCISCKNVVMRGSGLEAHSDYLVPLLCPDHRQLDMSSNEDHWRKQDLLCEQQHVLGKGAFGELEKSIGANCNPDGLLRDVPMRSHFLPASALTYDAMHVLFANGVMNLELHLLVKAARERLRLRYRDFRAKLAAWSWPDVRRRAGHDLLEVFSDAREAVSHDAFKASAAEVLAVYPWLHFVALHELAQHQCVQAEVASFSALCKVASSVMSLKSGAPWQDVALRLPALINEYLARFAVAYPGEERPKHHFLHHLPNQISRDRCLLDCWVHERKHSRLKTAAAHVDNTSNYEASALSKTLSDQMHQLADDACFRDGLVGASCQCPLQLWRMPVRVARAAASGGLRVGSGDFLIADGHMGEVTACLEVGSSIYFACTAYAKTASVVDGVSRWKASDDQYIVSRDLHAIFLASCWRVDADGVVIVP